MKTLYQPRSLGGFCLALLLCFTPASWADDDDIERIFFFGDSLSDSGNIFEVIGITAEAPWAAVPSEPYAFADKQFSNGRTWARRFAKHLDTRRSGKASLRRPGKFGNYAFGGARAGGGGTSPSGPDQLNMYLADYGFAADDEALYVIQFGGNDIRDALDVLEEDPDDFAGAAAIVGSAIEAEAGMITNLYLSGARQFLVADVPNLALAPAITLSGPEAVFAASTLVGLYNDGLESALLGLEAALPGIRIKRLSFFGILNELVANPKKYGFRNTTDSCLMILPPATEVCDRPNKYVFWDGIHPTRKVHRIVGEIAAELYDD